MNNKYIQPNQTADSYTCPHCNTLSQMDRESHYFSRDVLKSINGCLDIKNRLKFIDVNVAAKKLYGTMIHTFIQILLQKKQILICLKR